MKQVIQSARTGKLALADVPAPKVRAGHLLVRTRASLISAGTERLVVDFARKSLAGKARARPDLVKKVLSKAKRDGLAATFRAVMARLDEPLPLGYSAVGTVVEVGAGLEGLFEPGQRVACAGAGLANHAEVNVVPQNLAAPVPDGVADEEAAFGTLASIALHGVRNLGPQLGDVVAVLGVGLLGQLMARLLALSGARPVALDYDPARLELAKTMGAEAAFDLAAEGIDEGVQALTQGRGCDGVLIAAATDSSEPFRTTAAIARDRARVVMVGLTGTEFPYREFMQKELNLVVSRSYGPGRYDEDFETRGVKYPVGFVRWTETENLAECVRLMDPALSHRLDVAPLITHRFPFDRAEDAYAMVTGGTEPHLGVVMTYDDSVAGEVGRIVSFPAANAPSRVGCSIGMIGAGNFARTVLLPELKRIPGVTLHTLATRRGASADHSAQAHGFLQASTDEAAVLENPDIDAVIVATRHDSHADLTARALAAGKSVLVEKPLALDREQLNRVIKARNGADAFFQVGFNRRFAPHSVAMRERLAGQEGPKFLLLRINAGAVPPGTWLESGEGGGRILGEVCHFVDLARHLVGSPIESVQANAARVTAGTCDDLSATLRFADGSLATVAYTALGDTAFSKELIEAYSGGTVTRIDDFRRLGTAAGGRVDEGGKGTQDKGFRPSVQAFVEAVKQGGPAPIDEAELIETTLATIAVLESLRSGTAQKI